MIKESIDAVLKELNINNLEGDERYEVTAQLVDHFQEIIIETVLTNLDVEQLKRFKEIVEMEDPEKLDEELSLLVAQIPGINFKIDDAIKREVEFLKEGKAVMDASA